MAFITELFELSSTSMGRDHSTCSAGCRVTERVGERVLQIDTYGSSDRQIPNKKSQSLRFSPEAIEQLKAIFRRL